jgi:general secretion pathway protein D
MKKTLLLFAFTGLNFATADLTRRVDTFSFSDAELKDVVRLVATVSGFPVVCTPDASKKVVSIYFNDTTLEAALQAMCRANGLFMTVSPEEVAIISTIEQHIASQALYAGDYMETVTVKYPSVLDVGDTLKGLFRERIVWERPDDEDIDTAYQIDQALERMQLLTSRSQFDSFAHNQEMSRSTSRSSSRSRNTMRGSDEVRQIRDLQSGEQYQIDRLASQALSGDLQDAPSSALIYITSLPEVNTLLIRSSDRSAVQLVKKAVEEIDKPRGQVLLRVSVLAVSLNDSEDTGVEWLMERGDASIGFADAPIQSLSDSLSDYTINAPVASVISEHIKVRLKALKKEERLKGLANPSILVADNEAANVFIGREAKFLNQIVPGTVVNTDGGITTTDPTPEFIDRNIGLSLLITPRVHADHSVTLRIMQERTRVEDNLREIDYGADRPIKVQDIDQEVVTSTLVAENDSLVVLGGLITESTVETERGVPFLKEIPWLGALVRSKGRTEKREELMVVVRPYVIAAPGDVERTSRRVLDQLKIREDASDELSLLDDIELRELSAPETETEDKDDAE